MAILGLKTADVFRILIFTTGAYMVFMTISQYGSSHTTVQTQDQFSLSDLGVVNFEDQVQGDPPVDTAQVGHYVRSSYTTPASLLPCTLLKSARTKYNTKPLLV